MFTVIKKPLTPNTIWDTENRCPLCKFKNGKLETNDTALAEKLKAMGHEVTGEADAAGGSEESQSEDNIQEQNEPDGPMPDEETSEDEPMSDKATGEAEKTPAKRRNRK